MWWWALHSKQMPTVKLYRVVLKVLQILMHESEILNSWHVLPLRYLLEIHSEGVRGLTDWKFSPIEGDGV